MRFVRRMQDPDVDALTAAVIERLGLNPNHVTAEGITAEYVGGTSPVVLRWSSVITIPAADWEQFVADTLEPPP